MQSLERLKRVLLELIQEDANWLNLFQYHGWDIEYASLADFTVTEFEAQLLETELSIDRTTQGFKEFNPGSDKLIDPGNPASSFLYHAFSSPSVTTIFEGAELRIYPSWADIEVLENCIYALKKASLESLVGEAVKILGFPDTSAIELGVACYALEYRNAAASVHGAYADLCFSRTGVARVGNRSPFYDPQLRGFKVYEHGDDDHDIRVLPCRYAAFIAARLKGRADRFGPVDSMSEAHNDSTLDFWVPLHKLFNGSECLLQETIDLTFTHQHYNQKLEKLTDLLNEGGFTPYGRHERDQAPFRMSHRLADFGDVDAFGHAVIIPKPNPLVAEAKIGCDAVFFKVPPMKETPHFYDSFAPTLAINSVGNARPWPEYAHVRTEVKPDGAIVSITDNVNVVEYTTEGGYNALHYLDFAADGWVNVELLADLHFKGKALMFLPAYSLVAAPDFFPKVRQRHVFEWWRNARRPEVYVDLPKWWQSLIQEGAWASLWRASPEPLSDERVAANVAMPDSPFSPDDNTITAVVSQLRASAESKPPLSGRYFDVIPYSQRSSSLSDAAAGVFAPGWDTSYDHNQGVDHLAAYGLGSPFPEDAKLCAALSTFWPAAAPDTQRTFFEVPYSKGTVAPLTDAEIGSSEKGIAWDGVVGPQVVESNAQTIVVDYPSYPRADYTRNAFEGRFSLALTSQISLEEYKRRIISMLRCYKAIGELRNKERVHVISFKHVHSFNHELDEAQSRHNVELTGPVFRIEGFINKSYNAIDNVEELDSVDDINRRRFRVVNTWMVFVGRGDYVLVRARTVGDGTITRSGWELLDV